MFFQKIRQVACVLALLNAATFAFAQTSLPFTVISPSPTPLRGITGLAVASDGTAWASVADGNLYEVDRATGAFTLVGAFGNTVRDLAIDRSDQLYGMCEGAEANVLCSIDTATGEATLIGSGTGLSTYFAAITFVGSTLYYVQNTGEGGGTIDTTTGVATPTAVPSDGVRSYGTTALGYDPSSGLLIGNDCCDTGVGGQSLISFNPADMSVVVLGIPTGTQQFHDFAVYSGVVYAVTGGGNKGLDDSDSFGTVSLPLPRPAPATTPVPALPLFGLLALGGLLGLFGLRKLKQ